MRLLFPILVLLACLVAAPAAAQLHERGVTRAGAVQSTTTGGNAFMCRMACTIESGCTGWNWTRAGEDGPQSRCELLAGVTAAEPDSCCDSGLNGDPRPPDAIAGVAPPRGNQYANRSQTPTGPPVQLVGDPTGGIWEEGADPEEESSDADEEGSADETLLAEEEDDARFDAVAQSEPPAATTPSARITSTGPRTGGAPRYSVQREYQGVPAQPAAPPAEGMADPGRWIDG